MKTTEAKANDARARADASFKKEERAREGAAAMTEYIAQGRMARERMAQLRALRLAKEAAESKAEAEVEVNEAPPARKRASSKRASRG